VEVGKSVKLGLLRRLCRSALLSSLPKNRLILYLHLLLEAHPRSLTGTLAWAGLSRRLTRSHRTLKKSTRELERLGFVALDPRAPASLLRYRLLRGDQWGSQP